jgi:replicative DNA helicase
VPPQNLEAEESILGAMLLSPKSISDVTDLLEPTDFYRGSHAKIYRAALSLYERGEAVDAITVADELEERGELEAVGGKARIHELAALTPATSNVAHHARIVKEMGTLRGMIRVGSETQRLGYERPADTAELVDRVQQMAYELTPGSKRSGTEMLGASLSDTFGRIEQLAAAGSDVVGVSTGFRSLDRLTLGFEPGNLIIVAARPGMGKSALALDIAAHVAIREGLPVALFTMEMSRQEVAQRALARQGKVDLQRIRSGKGLGPDDWSRLAGGAATLEKAPLLVNDSGTQTVGSIRSEIRRTMSRHPDLGLVIVDYLQLMAADGQNRTEQVTNVSRGLKVLASDFGVPVIAVSQLSREVEKRISDRRPILPDLRDSGSIEQDANMVLFIYREGYYNPDCDTPDLTEVIVAKNRNGPAGGDAKVELMWKRSWTTFTEVAQ